MLSQLNLYQIESAGMPGNRIPVQIADVITLVLPYVFGAAGIALLVYLVLGGFQMMTAQGDPKAIQAAQGKITNALIGFVIVFVSFFVVQILGQLFGIQNTPFGQIFK